MLHCVGPAVLVVEEVHGGGITDGHTHQLAALVTVGVQHTVHGLACPQTIRTIGIGNIIGAVVVARRVADGSLVPAMESEDSMALVVLQVLPLC